MIDTAVCVMAKAPVPGQVKTRLVPPFSRQQAAALAAAFLEDTWAAACGVDGAVVVLARAGGSERWPSAVADAQTIAQPGGDLGARIEAVAAAGLERARAAVVIGSDLPGLPTAHIVAARARLEESDAVIGPSSDGGYYLIGLRRAIPGVLGGVSWSAPETRQQTIDALRAAGLSVGFAPAFDDIDDPADVERLRTELFAGTVVAEATERALATLR